MRSAEEDSSEELRLTYVALTRAESQVVVWWAPSDGASSSGLTRLLLGRPNGEVTIPASVRLPSPPEVGVTLATWASQGAFALEPSEVAPAVARRPAEPLPAMDVRKLPADRVDEAWQRTSYSGLIRAEEQLAARSPETEPEVEGTVDEVDAAESAVAVADAPVEPDAGVDLPSPMASLPAGATFGSLVHGVLEHVDPAAQDLAAETLRHVVEQLEQWPVDASAEAVAEALLPLQSTSLGPLADGLRLIDIPRLDRLCELDFEIPLSGGDVPTTVTDVQLSVLGQIMRRHLAPGDPMLAYADQLATPTLGGQSLRGYLSGSIDVVLRVPDGDGHRYLVVDYKTNRLGDGTRPVTAVDYRPDELTTAMLHSHYPLQAMLYAVVLHRFLRWRLPDYDPERHLGGILYLYLRGMCGPDTPEFDGHPCGVFAWKPPAAMVVEMASALDGALDD
jgi:exodeoxyribonuclease V beta subunit